MRHPAILILLLLFSFASAMDPPELLWEVVYTQYDGCFFSDMELLPGGHLFLSGAMWVHSGLRTDYYIALKLDTDGNVIKEIASPLYSAYAQASVVLSDGSKVVTGESMEAPDSSISLFITKLDTNENVEWTKIYDYPDTKEEGYGITCLPDGGFAVCGRVHGTGIQQGEAWLLRTDSEGDTLWTRTWGTHFAKSTVHYGQSVLFNNGEISVLAKGTDDTLTTNGTHMLFYDLDGNYLRGTDYPELYWDFPRGMCLASDGGYTFVTDASPVIWHTDQYGETLWWDDIYSYGNDEGYDIKRTMDNGYIFSGWCGEEPGPSQRNDCTRIPAAGVDTGWTQDAWLVKFDEEGNQQWEFKREAQTTHCHYYSVVQLPEGGYVACGLWSTSGYLARFAPETGITEPDPSTSLSLEVFPNPCSSVLSLRFSLIETGAASISIYDLSGRLVDTIADEMFSAGENTVEWAVPSGISSGCYLIQYNSALGSISERCVLIN